MRNASASPSNRAPNTEDEPVRRATGPSTASSSRAATARATTVATDRLPDERLRDECGHAAGEHDPDERHEVGRAERLRTPPRQATHDRRTDDQPARESDGPARRRRARRSP